jgi:N-acetylmuramic acid 6-phosphate etherase
LKITEQSSPYRHLEKMSIEEITAHINNEDKTVAYAIERALPQLNRLIKAIVDQLQAGGRLFYLGAGSGGRLSVLDAIEIPTTYGASKDTVTAIIAGGIEHLIEAREDMEDDIHDGWNRLLQNKVSAKDIVVGITASGTTPFVVEAIKTCKNQRIPTGCIVSNPGSPVASYSSFPVEIITGPEFLTGSTRMKCGTAQKMVFDIISTTTMIQLGRVEDNRMVDVMLVNEKIIDRAVNILMNKSGLEDYEKAKSILLANGSVRKAFDKISQGDL